MKPTGGKLLVWTLVNLFGVAAAACGVHALTGNRILEAACALAVVPGTVALARRSYGLRGAPKASQVSMIEMTSVSLAMLAILFTANLVLWLTNGRFRIGGDPKWEVLTALYMTMIPTFAINAVEGRIWSRQASRL